MVVGLEDAGKLAWSPPRKVSRLMSKLGPCCWPHWLAHRPVPGPPSEIPGLTQRRPLSGSSATHLQGRAGFGGLGNLR